MKRQQLNYPQENKIFATVEEAVVVVISVVAGMDGDQL